MTIEGAALCDGEWMLFMDADAHLAPGTLKRAISFAEQSALHCVSVVPQVGPAGLVGDAVFDVSLALMSNGGRLREVRDAASRQVAATGAFILVRKAAVATLVAFTWLCSGRLRSGRLGNGFSPRLCATIGTMIRARRRATTAVVLYRTRRLIGFRRGLEAQAQ